GHVQLLAMLPRTCLFLSPSLFTHPPTPYIYTLSLHDALPILLVGSIAFAVHVADFSVDRIGRDLFEQVTKCRAKPFAKDDRLGSDRKSTRLNSSHGSISYAVFCLKKKKLCGD